MKRTAQTKTSIKMIFAAAAVPSIRQTMGYVLGPGNNNVPDRASLVGGQGFEFDLKTDEDVKLATELMEHKASPGMQASPTKKCTLTALHASASWEPSQRASQDEMLEAGRHFLKSVGMANSMAIFQRHGDLKRDHMHMVACMIDPKTGLTYKRYQFLYKAQHAALEWERKRGQITPARQPQHDLANAARELDWDRLQALLRNKDGQIAYGKVNHALALGGHFGSRMVEHGVQFKKYLEADLKREPVQKINILDLFAARDEERGMLPPTQDKEPPRRGQTERGDLEDRTDQTAEGRAYIKRQRGRGLER